MATNQELLDKVDAKIAAIIDGDDVTELTIGDETMKFASLRELQQMRNDLVRKVNASSQSPFLTVEFDDQI
jgi:hypothetical protein